MATQNRLEPSAPRALDRGVAFGADPGAAPPSSQGVVSGEVRSAIYTMAAVVAVTFLVELVVMWTLARFGHAPAPAPMFLLDAALLALASSPLIYVIVLRPLKREHETRLLAERRAAMLGRLAMTDWLTRLANRHGIEVALLEAMAVSERYGRALTVALIDIDHFKSVNDLHGHDAGDQVLTRLANILSRCVRAPDSVGRHGGEEFLLVFPETPLEAALLLVERVRALIAGSDLEVGEKTLRTTVSAG